MKNRPDLQNLPLDGVFRNLPWATLVIASVVSAVTSLYPANIDTGGPTAGSLLWSKFPASSFWTRATCLLIAASALGLLYRSTRTTPFARALAPLALLAPGLGCNALDGIIHGGVTNYFPLPGGSILLGRGLWLLDRSDGPCRRSRLAAYRRAAR